MHRLEHLMKLFCRTRHYPQDPASALAHEFRLELALFHKQLERIMSALDDLKAAIADLATELADNNAEIELLLTKITTPSTSDADVAAAVADIRALIATNKAEVDKAKAAVP